VVMTQEMMDPRTPKMAFLSVHEVTDRRTVFAVLIALTALVVLINTRQSDYFSSTTVVCFVHPTCLIASHAIALIVPPLPLMQEQDGGE